VLRRRPILCWRRSCSSHRPVPSGPDQLHEPLSARERDVLHLVLAGRSGPEIDELLVVAPSTVKTHLKNIYDKLDVHRRDQAIARVRELKLL
jgi:LuxR family transcriptional regulator, maltose regulon positive regulatory protein